MPLYKYERNNLEVHNVRLSVDDKAAAGPEAVGAVTSQLKAKVTRSVRGYGLRPRAVILTRPVSPSATDKIFYKRLTVLTATSYDSAPFADNQTITIKTVAWKVIGRDNERVR